MMGRFFFTLMVGSFLALTCQKNDQDGCFELSFDERQCQTDDFLTGAETPDEKVVLAGKYLEKAGIRVRSSRFDPQYLSIVCEACHVCPTGLRFFFKTGAEDTSKFSRLNVLNPETQACE